MRSYLNEKRSGSRSRKQRLTAVGTRCADDVTLLYPQKLALTSPTGGGCSVGIVRVRTKTTEFSFIYIYIYIYLSISIENSCKTAANLVTLFMIIPPYFSILINTSVTNRQIN